RVDRYLPEPPPHRRRSEQAYLPDDSRLTGCAVAPLLPLEFHNAPHAPPFARLHDVDIATRVAPDSVTGPMDRVTPTRQPLAVERQDADHAAVVLGDVNDVVRIDIKERRADQFGRPDLQQFSLLIEHLHAIVLAIGDQQPSAPIDPHAMRQIELPRRLARLAPREQMLRVRRDLMHARIAVTI